ncbi:MAG: hypothetical protein VX496_08620, partial [Planctomycetota bacterium]|nr:hypothetical protein [Planctomycetota bacterium]
MSNRLLLCRAGFICFLALCSGAVPGAFAQPQQASDQELSREQEQIRAIVIKLANDMEKVAAKLEAGEPQDAERLREAARQIRNQRLPDTLSQIEGMLSSKQFIEAVSSQNDAIKVIEGVLSVLEASQFSENRTSEQLEQLKNQRRIAGELKQQQERLLDETREFLDSRQNSARLQALQEMIRKALEMQKGLLDGKPVDQIDSEGKAQDREAIDSAIEEAQALQKLQERVTREIEKLPSGKEPQKDQQAIADATKVLEELDGLIRKARGLNGDLRDLGSRAEELKQMAGEAKVGNSEAGQDKPANTGKEGGGEKAPRGGESQPGKDAGKDSPGKDAGKDSPGEDA